MSAKVRSAQNLVGLSDCLENFKKTVVAAGGTFSVEMLELPLWEFIAGIAGPNNIRFVHIPIPQSDKPVPDSAIVVSGVSSPLETSSKR